MGPRSFRSSGCRPSRRTIPSATSTGFSNEVLRTFSRPDTLTCSLQDWRKGRRAEIDEVNGYAVDILRRHGHEAKVNQRVIEIAFDIEKGRLEADPKNASALIECLAAARS
jgi:2-dehydropantoate 2-reductase